MAQRGGKRPGAGRKAGSTNKQSKASIAKARATADGELPHEWLLRIMRGEKMEVALESKSAVDGTPAEQVIVSVIPTLEDRIKAAIAAAPFYAPKLAAQALVQAPDENPIDALMNAVAESATNRARAAR
jgi:hypothetical protein